MEVNLTGKWQGTIIYGKEYGDLRNKELYFDLNIQQSGDKIEGIAKDTGGFGMNESEATIKGIYIGNRIDFIKKYALFSVTDGDKKTLWELEKMPGIFYSGIFNIDTNAFEGRWEYRQQLIQRKNEKVYQINRAIGTWNMRRL